MPDAHGFPPENTDIHRMEILQRVASAFNRVKPRKEASKAIPYRGSQLNQGLIDEAYGTELHRLRAFEPDIFLVPGRITHRPATHTVNVGQMHFAKPRDYHLYVWQRIPARQQHASIFRLIGLVEAGRRPKGALLEYPTYTIGRRMVQPVGRDSLIDYSEPVHVRN